MYSGIRTSRHRAKKEAQSIPNLEHMTLSLNLCKMDKVYKEEHQRAILVVIQEIIRGSTRHETVTNQSRGRNTYGDSRGDVFNPRQS